MSHRIVQQHKYAHAEGAVAKLRRANVSALGAGEFEFGSDEEFDEKLGFDDADFDEDTFDDFEPDDSSGWAAEGSVADASGAMINTGRADWCALILSSAHFLTHILLTHAQKA